MRAAAALSLSILAATHALGWSDRTDYAAIEHLDGSVWIDLGVGVAPEDLTPKQLGELKLCKTPSMSFERTPKGLVQTFYAGIAMRTPYSPITTTKDGNTTILHLHDRASGKLVETLRISRDGSFLLQWAVGFRPHTYLRCPPPGGAGPSVQQGIRNKAKPGGH